MCAVQVQGSFCPISPKRAANPAGLVCPVTTEVPETQEEGNLQTNALSVPSSDTQYKMTISMADWPSEASEVTLTAWFVTDTDGSCSQHRDTRCGQSWWPQLKSLFSTHNQQQHQGWRQEEGPLSSSSLQGWCQPKPEPPWHSPGSLQGQGGFPQAGRSPQCPAQVQSIPPVLGRAQALREHRLPLLLLNSFCFPRTGFSIFCLTKGICQQM